MKQVVLIITLSLITASALSAQIRVKYHGEINAGYSIGVGSYAKNRLNLNTIQGVQAGEYFSVGFGLGLDWYRGLYSEYWEKQGMPDMGELAMPLFLNFKGYLPLSDTLTTYLTFDIGYGIGLTEGVEGYGGLYMTPGVGIKMGKFKAEVGFNMQQIIDVLNINANAFKLSLGYIF